MVSRGERRAVIRAALRQRSHVTVREIVKDFGISRSSAWRDVDALVAGGDGVKAHGGIARSDLTGLLDLTMPGERAPVLGMQVPDDRGHFAPIVAGAAEACRERGVRLHVRTTSYWDVDEVNDSVREMCDAGADGLLVVPVGADYWRSGVLPGQFARFDLPVVLVDREAAGLADHGAYESVSTDVETGIYVAVDHLVGLGHSRLLLLTIPERSRLRDKAECAFVAATADLLGGRNGGTVAHLPRRADLDPIVATIRRTLSTGVIVYGPRLAMSLCARLADTDDLTVPEFVSVISYGDDMCWTGAAGICAVAPALGQVGQVAAVRMIEHLTGLASLTGQRTCLPPRLVRRSSTGPTMR